MVLRRYGLWQPDLLNDLYVLDMTRFVGQYPLMCSLSSLGPPTPKYEH